MTKTCLLFSFLLFFYFGMSQTPMKKNASSKPITENSIKTVVSETEICMQSQIKVAYNATGKFKPQNYFVAELSNAEGVFFNGTILGMLKSQASDTIMGTFPAYLKPSNKYRIRVKSTRPEIIGSDNGFDISIGNNVTPTVTISTFSTNFCKNDTVTFKASFSYGGGNPDFYWKINGVYAQKGPNNYFKTTNLSAGDSVSCEMVSKIKCATSYLATSNQITMNEVETVVPVIGITTRRTDFCVGSEVMFEAIVRNGGENPTFDWKVNNISTGFGTKDFTTSELRNDDVVTCLMTSSMGCSIPSSVGSNSITMKGFEPLTYYRDKDRDGYGNDTVFVITCVQPSGYVLNPGDCDDDNSSIYPGAVEICDGIDNNCNGLIDENCQQTRIIIEDGENFEGNGEKNRYVVLTARLLNHNGELVLVDYTTVDSTATQNIDYLPWKGTLAFKATQDEFKIHILIFGDRIPEPNEHFKIVLSNPVNAVIEKAIGVGTIIDDDRKANAKDEALAQVNGKPEQSIIVSPNPANGLVNANIKGFTGNLELLLSDANGRVLTKKKIYSASTKEFKDTLNISGIDSGIYFVSVVDKDGNKRVARVLIH